MPKLALSMIVKDDSEVASLQNSLYSVLPYVQFAQITSNGEKTAEIEALIASVRETFPNVEFDYDYLPWTDDFSIQRNHSFNRIPKDTDYIYWQDADDILVGGEWIQNLAAVAKQNGKDVVFLSYWYGCTFSGEPSLETFQKIDIEHYRERLIRPGTIVWKGRLHETPVPVVGQKDNYSKYPYHPKERPIAVMHLSKLEEAKEKMMRNKNILELQLSDERKSGEADPRTLLYLMKIYAEIATPELLTECLKMGKEYLAKSGWDEERATCCDVMSQCYSKQGNTQAAIQLLHQALLEYPHTPLLYVRLALAYFNVGRFDQSRHWLEVAGRMEYDRKTSGINSIQELKILMAQLILKLKFQVDGDIDGSVEAAKVLLQEQPSKENEANLLYLLDRKDLKDASENSLQLMKYLESIGDKQAIEGVLNSLPLVISEQPFALGFRKKVMKPRLWKENEVCYFANFGGKHFEKWSGRSVEQGIGGSELSVIKLSEQWADLGYKVTVYGDPEYMGEYKGVTYLPWYYFNKGDKFNIFIQWRIASLAPYIKAKKFYVDLHDVWNSVDYPERIMDAVDGVFVKSEYHKQMASHLLEKYEDKFHIISNGIDL